MIVVAAACGGPELAPTGPQAPPSVQLIRCQPAVPPPVTVSEGATDAVFGTNDVRPPSWDGGKSIAIRQARPGWGKHVPNVVVGTPTYDAGGLDAAVIGRVLHSQIAALRACYDKELATNAALSGKLAVSFTIDPDGKVSAASTGGVGAANSLSPCVVRVMRGLVFPRPVGGSLMVTYPLAFDTATPAVPDERVDAASARDGLARPWTPFALDRSPPLDTAPTIARATEGPLRARMAAIGACFPGLAPTGSLRAMLELDAGGSLIAARVGGLGDEPIERCVASALEGLRVMTPAADSVEVACDLSRGDARPWRVAPAAGYEVIEASRTQLVHGTEVIALGASEPPPLPAGATYLVLADADAPGTLIELALAWAAEGDATLIASRDGPRPPALIGMGRSEASVGDDYDDAAAVRATLALGATTLTACVHRTIQTAGVADVAAIGGLLTRVAMKCRKIGCASTLRVAIDGGAVARDLLEVMAAARRAGFERVLIGGLPGCQASKGSRDDPR